MRDKAPKHKGRGGAKKSHGVFDFFEKKKLFYVVDYYLNIFWLNILKWLLFYSFCRVSTSVSCRVSTVSKRPPFGASKLSATGSMWCWLFSHNGWNLWTDLNELLLIDLVGRLLELSRDSRNACTTWIFRTIKGFRLRLHQKERQILLCRMF